MSATGGNSLLPARARHAQAGLRRRPAARRLALPALLRQEGAVIAAKRCGSPRRRPASAPAVAVGRTDCTIDTKRRGSPRRRPTSAPAVAVGRARCTGAAAISEGRSAAGTARRALPVRARHPRRRAASAIGVTAPREVNGGVASSILRHPLSANWPCRPGKIRVVAVLHLLSVLPHVRVPLAGHSSVEAVAGPAGGPVAVRLMGGGRLLRGGVAFRNEA